MTNLKDLLNDFAEDVKKVMENGEKENLNWELEKEQLIYNLLKIIKERLIGD